MNEQSNTLHIHVSNLNEDVDTFIGSMDTESRQNEITENAALSDRAIFYFTEVSNLLLLVPRSIDTDFLQYFLDLFPKDYLHVRWPEGETGEISLDVVNDENLMREIQERMSFYSHIDITSYSSTQQFLELLHELRYYHANITASETPTDISSVNYFGSKTGIREASYDGETELFQMCEGKTVMGLEEIVQVATEFYKKHSAVVIKTNKGHATMGVLLIKPGTLDQSGIEEQIRRMLTEDYWALFPSVVEKYIDPDTSVGGGLPNAECFVDQNGITHFLYTCGMRMSGDDSFRGVEIGRGVLPDHVETELRSIGETLGNLYAQNGYVGYFDIDCIYGKDKKLYVSESNVRRTGGTHVYLTAESIFGPDFMNQTYALSNNLYQIADKKPRTFNTLHAQLEPILFDQEKKEGLLIIAANLLDSANFGYIIFGKDKQSAYKIEAEMERLLAN